MWHSNGLQTEATGMGRRRDIAKAAAAAILLAMACETIPHAWSQTQPVQIISQPILLVEPAVETPFSIQLNSSSQVPKQAFVRIRGLPPAAVLSEGHAIKAGTWAVPLTGLANLMVTVAAGSEGKFQVLVALVLVDGTVVRETEVTLAVMLTAASNQRASQAPVNSASLGAGPALPSPPPQASPLASPPLKLAPEREAPPPALSGQQAVPQLKSEDRDRAIKYVQRGDESLAAGNITMARLFYQKAAEVGLAQGALALAGTYDPAELARLKVVGGVDPDRATAQKWYEKARQLGSPQAAERLLKLGVR